MEKWTSWISWYLCSLGGTCGPSESSHLQESSVHYNIPELQSTPGRPPQTHSQPHANAHSFPHPLPQTHPQSNGQHTSVPPHREASGTRDNLSDPDESEEEEEEEDEAPPSRWQGIESIFEAYQEYIEGEKPRRILNTVIHLCCFINIVDIKQNVFPGMYSELNPINPCLFLDWRQHISIADTVYLSAVVLLCSHKVATFFLHLTLFGSGTSFTI